MASSAVTPRAYSIPLLTAANYSTWSIKIEMLLIRSELWTVVNGTEVTPPESDVARLAAWRLKDSKARSDILLHCGEKQLITFRPLPTSKAVWDRIKQLYEKSNTASQVHLYKQLCRMSMTDSEDVVAFLESWQSTLQEAAISGCIFIDAQQVNLLLGALPDSWSAFVTTQGGISDLSFHTLLSNILQQNSINTSKLPTSKTNAFYAKGKFIKSSQYKPYQSRYRKSNFSKPNPSHQFNMNSSSQQTTIICHYCGKPGHKAPDCRKKKRDLTNGKFQNNNYTSDESLHLFSATVSNSTISDFWYLGSGASQHMTPIQNLFYEYHLLDHPKTIFLGDNSFHTAFSYGSIILQLKTGELLTIPDVLYVRSLAKNLLFVAQITNTGNTIVIFTKDQCIIKSKSPTTHHSIAFQVKKDGNLFPIGIGMPPSIKAYSATTLSKSNLETITWHHRLGHLNIRSIKTMQSQDLVIGIPSLRSMISTCEGCIFGKHHKLPYSKDPVTRATELLALIHTNLCGLMHTKSFGKALYFITFIDDYSRYTYVYFLQ